MDDPARRDDIEANALYELVENEVAARFYDRDDAGLPVRWLEMVRHTLKSLGPKVLATRMVRDYVLELYAPAARTARVLRDGHTLAGELADWKRRVRDGWPSVRIEHIEATGIGDSPEVGSTLSVQMFAAMDGLTAEDVQAEVVYGSVRDDDTLARVRAAPLSHAEEYEGGRHRFRGEVKLETTGPFGYTVRVLPAHELMADPAEMGLVAWPGDPVPPGVA